MKEQITLKIGAKQYPLYLTIGDMRLLERGINRSILSVMTGGLQAILEQINIDCLIELVRYGVHDEKHGRRSDDECYDFLQAYCDDGHDLDEVTGLFIQAIWNTGLYVNTAKTRKNAQTTEPVKK